MKYKANQDILVEVRELSKYFMLYKNKRTWLKQRFGLAKKANISKIRAIDGISFSLKKGDSLAIVGRNGCGKSTLLQLISGTLKPSAGEIKIRGRMAALLELGSGFNPEFTGRENIILNGILMGLTKSEVLERINDIINYADIGVFIDQPLKTYSSGMIVRLAFAIISNVDADILIIDEALAVGDTYFTQKCMRFIQRFRKRGILIFVSHDPFAILNLCDKGILIEKGMERYTGSPKEVLSIYGRDTAKTKEKNDDEDEDEDEEKVVNQYNENKPNDYYNENDRLTLKNYKMRWTDYRAESKNLINNKGNMKITKFEDRMLSKENFGGTEAQIISVDLKNIEIDTQNTNYINGGEILRLNIKIKANKVIDGFIAGFIIKNEMGLTILGDNTLNNLQASNKYRIEKGEVVDSEFIFTIPMLRPGKYSIAVSVAKGSQENHTILLWKNESIIIESRCDSIAAGIAGVTMHSIRVKRKK